MNKLTFYETRKFTSLALIGTMAIGAVTLTSCNKEEEVDVVDISKEETAVNNLKQNLKNIFPNLDDEIIEDTSLILLLDVLAPKDENEKMYADVIAHFKPIINEDRMMENFNDFLSVYENAVLIEGKEINLSNALPENLKNDKVILSHIEGITKTILNGTDSTVINSEFDKLYTLFVKQSPENKITVDGLEFGVRDLSYGARAIAQSYARIVISSEVGKKYIPEEKREQVDARTNNQDNKAYIKSDLRVLANQMIETSEIDVAGAFNNHYLAMETYVDCKVNLSKDDINNLVNILNLNYLNSDKVSTADRNKILGTYSDENLSKAVVDIISIDKYNNDNQNEMLTFSNFIIGENKKTTSGKIDSVALDFVQYNKTKLLNSINKNSSFSEVFNNPYFQNIYKYLTKQDFTHKYPDGTTYNISWEEIGDEANLANNTLILYTLKQLPNVKGMDTFLAKAKTNLGESIQTIQIEFTGECEKVNVDVIVKAK